MLIFANTAKIIQGGDLKYVHQGFIVKEGKHKYYD